MTISLILLKQISIMLIFMGIGYVLFQKQFITIQGSKELGNLLLYIILPSSIVKSFLIENIRDKTDDMLIALLLSFVTVLISLFLANFILKKDKISQFSASFSNAGFMGIPLVQAVFNQETIIYITSLIVIINLLQWTYGVFIMTGSYESIKFSSLGKNPIIISALAGVVIIMFNISVPEAITSTVLLCSGMNAPIAMIIMGIYLAQTNWRQMLLNKKVYRTTIVRLIIIPLITGICLFAINKDYYVIKMAIFIAAATPVGSNVAIFAHQNKLDYTNAVNEVCFSTIISIVTLPLMVKVVEMVFEYV